ncbi:MAG: aminopeptidase P family N-terminal domain-containing protein [Xanthobacteraceae bacterium]
MRRGLMGWDAEELPVGVLDDRVRRLRAAMQRGGVDALLIYTNLVRPSAVSYLTGFTPYWSEGILLVGRAGPPTFATALSKRVANWIRSVSPVGEIVNTPQPGKVLGERLAADPAVQRVGVLEIDAFPSGSYDDLVAAAPGREFVDATDMFAAARRGADEAEQRLLARADAIAVAALDQVGAGAATDAGSIAGEVEKHARLNGAEEAYIAVAPDVKSDRRMIRAAPALALGDRFALRASIAYKGHWVRRARIFAKNAADRTSIARADHWFAELMRSIEPVQPLAEHIAARIGQLPGGALVSWMAESSIGSYPLQVVAGSHSPSNRAPAERDLLVLSLELTIDGSPWLGAAPAIVGGGDVFGRSRVSGDDNANPPPGP